MSTITKKKEQTALEQKLNAPWHILIINDDVNTFEHVIDTLVKYCGHSPEQAYQCSLIIHHSGKCSVKVGEYDELRPIYEAILEEKIRAKIEET